MACLNKKLLLVTNKQKGTLQKPKANNFCMTGACSLSCCRSPVCKITACLFKWPKNLTWMLSKVLVTRTFLEEGKQEKDSAFFFVYKVGSVTFCPFSLSRLWLPLYNQLYNFWDHVWKFIDLSISCSHSLSPKTPESGICNRFCFVCQPWLIANGCL